MRPQQIGMGKFGPIYKGLKGKGIAVIRPDWNGKRKQWLVSAF